MGTSRRNLGRTLFDAASTAALLAGLAAPAQAQDAAASDSQDPAAQTGTENATAQAPDAAADQAGDEIVVTGFRASLRRSLSEKREATGIIDVIKAEDIADFPDNNLAESIQRIPGVAITRSAGEGRNITVRGLGPASTRVRVNGVETISTTGGSDADGGANRDRSFDFNIFASDLLTSTAVRKTASASSAEGSL